MSITTRQLADGTAEISPRGEIDVSNAQELADAVATVLAASAPKWICVDLWQVTLIDSVGISALVTAYKAAAASGTRLTLANPAPTVHRQLQVSGLVERFGLPTEPAT